MMRTTVINTDFNCLHCRNFVSAGHLYAGVNNRNHCPHCLWSRHMDLFKAGDRMSACKAPMEPIGLTMKRVTKKYPAVTSGELMLVHLCTECERISINRIAADDDPQRIWGVFSASTVHLNGYWNLIQDQDISILGYESLELVQRQLFGQHVNPGLVGATMH